ncbi:MAG: uracil-DNA glycosylase [Bacillota bacterium]
MDKWQDFKSDLQLCQNCALCKTRTNVVCGAGDPQSPIMVLGEAPGKEEDLSGQPFCGAAGKKLHGFLDQLGLDRDDIYISNIVKCRPVRPSADGQGYANRQPTRQEISACKAWLQRELSLINPCIIITLGAVPLSVFMPGWPKMQEYHGRPFKLADSSVTIFPLYHPAAVIYDRKKEIAYQVDLQCLHKFLREMRRNNI